ncbi:V-type proton ATPase subunit E-like [Daktulosphaira vitifoliae]|uniref:V-type proton ATPase subunit E-like n=1 Tax=Daktulosphaira vitifoliae TaxID=58002 RepID=UPI0021A98FC2|nr:V-type proton ATPase subunit E-like [Daktulosphaira vitifoliae]
MDGYNSKFINEEQRNQQLLRMIKFMEHEAIEIAQSINDLAEEEYHIQKGDLIHKGRAAINQFYKKKMKRTEREKATMISTQMTKAKLQILISRDEHIKSVLAAVNTELIELRDNTNTYREILKKLILQAMYKIIENNIVLIVRIEDIKIIQSMTDELKDEYHHVTRMIVHISIDASLNLSTQDIGGVIITDKRRRIFVDNTLLMRLIYLAIQAIPFIRIGLFGPNPSRKL